MTVDNDNLYCAVVQLSLIHKCTADNSTFSTDRITSTVHHTCNKYTTFSEPSKKSFLTKIYHKLQQAIQDMAELYFPKQPGPPHFIKSLMLLQDASITQEAHCRTFIHFYKTTYGCSTNRHESKRLQLGNRQTILSVSHN